MDSINYLKSLFFIILSFAVLSGCSSNRPLSNAEIGARNIEYEPTLTQKEAEVIPEYQLGFNDIIEIKFFNTPDFNETITVRPDGKISLQKIEELQVTGMTPSQLDSLITEKYKEFIKDPEITVIVREFGGYQVYVLGEVNSPGMFPLQRNMSILHALSTAGGAKNGAQLGNVMVLRQKGKNKFEALKIDVKKLLNSDNKEDVIQNNLAIKPYDIVYVPKTFVADAATFLTQVYAGVLPPINTVLRSWTVYDAIIGR